MAIDCFFFKQTAFYLVQ